jgi:hypothetical protein
VADDRSRTGTEDALTVGGIVGEAPAAVAGGKQKTGNPEGVAGFGFAAYAALSPSG